MNGPKKVRGKIVSDWAKQSLFYLHVAELKTWCEKLGLPSKGKKRELIFSIVHFVENGEKTKVAFYPNASQAKGKIIEPQESSLMLKGSYKNDLKNRLFFKKLIGEHFHFTAFGIDWLEDRWKEGKPPTYKEFALMWEKEYQVRKKTPVPPKAEWAFIRFVQDMLEKHPGACKTDILNEWNRAREKHKRQVDFFLSSFIK